LRKTKIYPLNKPVEVPDFGEFETVMLLNSNGSGKNLLALGTKGEYIAYSGGQTVLNVLDYCTKKVDDWLFGYLSYDLKNNLEELYSANPDFIGAPLFHFWQPQIVIEWDNNFLKAHYLDFPENDLDDIVDRLSHEQKTEKAFPELILQPRISKEDYLHQVNELKKQIRNGNVYELNFCQEFFAENVQLDGFSTYKKLNAYTQAPFSTYIKDLGLELMSASPELFLKKEGNRLISSPIKGTAKRGRTEEEDEALKQSLNTDPKEQAENIMIVDLVRNDLAKVARAGSVAVKELAKLYTFSSVHQLISTISAQLKDEVRFVDVIRATFPMGSMTGAPKIAAMKLAEEFESAKRGLYSGAIGYFSPEGDYIFNVVIRTLQYNSKNNYLSLITGGAITHLSDAEQEYQETLIKAEAIMRSLRS